MQNNIWPKTFLIYLLLCLLSRSALADFEPICTPVKIDELQKNGYSILAEASVKGEQRDIPLAILTSSDGNAEIVVGEGGATCSRYSLINYKSSPAFDPPLRDQLPPLCSPTPGRVDEPPFCNSLREYIEKMEKSDLRLLVSGVASPDAFRDNPSNEAVYVQVGLCGTGVPTNKSLHLCFENKSR